jgi:TonB family protein
MLSYKLTRFLILIFVLTFLQKDNFCNAQSKDSIPSPIEVIASFPGGVEEFKKYISQNIVYPKYEKENNISGKVVVCFEIDITGKVVNPRVVKSVSVGIDQEALRVISNMPLWTPAYQDGKVISTEYSMPINFYLSQSESKLGLILGYFVGGILGFGASYYLISNM